MDCFPLNAPEYIVKGKGCHVWDYGEKEYIDWGMSLRSVILGYGYPDVDEAVKKAINNGISFTRPSYYEYELSNLMHFIIPCAEMVKFGKSGSDVTSAAVRLARSYTGRNTILVAKENPFISQHDWFIGTTFVNGGIPDYSVNDTILYSYNNIEQLEQICRKNSIAAIIIDPATVNITRENLQYIRDTCNKFSCVMIMDEVISGFRYHISGVQGMFKITPDLATFGKAMANGYSISALCGKRELMELGDRECGDVFLLSGTYNSETTAYAAALATINSMIKHKCIPYVTVIGSELMKKFKNLIEKHYIQENIFLNSIYSCNPSISFSSMELKTLFDQCMVSQGILMPYIAPSFAHDDIDIDVTLEAFENALLVCEKAIRNNDILPYLIDKHVEKPVFRKRVML
jgi:glutamate-1-semialdehyde 2,1-aminomutase